MEADPRKRRERPGRGAQVHPKYHVYEPKDTTERDLEKLVLSFGAVTVPGDTAAGFLPDGSIYLLTRTADGVYTEPGDEDSAALLLVNGRAA